MKFCSKASHHYLGWIVLFCFAPINQALAGDILGDWLCLSNQESKEMQAQMQGTFSFDKAGFLNADMDITFTSDDLKVEANAKYLSKWVLEKNTLSETPVRVWITKYDINGVFARNSIGAEKLQWSLMQNSDVPATVSFISFDEMHMEHKGRLTRCQKQVDTEAGS